METTKIQESYLGLNTRKYLAENRRIILSFILFYIGFTIVAGIWSANLGATPSDSSEGIYTFIAGFICAIAASFTFNELATKEGRISLLMTPGTTLSKYLPRVLTTVLGMVILAVIGIYLLRATQIVTHGIAYKEWLPWDTGAITVQEDGLALGICVLISIFLFNEGLFVFGSAAWPKKSFLKTICVFILLQMALSLIGMTMAEKSVMFFKYSYSPDRMITIAWILTGITFAAAAGLFIWAYYKLKHAQVIK